MTPADSFTTEDGNALKNVARVDSENSAVALLLRDFFAEYGYAAVINQTSRVQADYHVICGSVQFVKAILASRLSDHAKRLLIVFDSHEEIPASFGVSGKEVLVDQEPFSKQMIETIFRFFFTSTSKRLDLRKNPKKNSSGLVEPATGTPAHVRPTERVSGDDEKRIRETISSMFSPPKKYSIGRKTRKKILTPLIVFLVLLPFVWYTISLTVAVSALGYAAFMLKSGNVGAAHGGAVLARSAAGQSKDVFSFIAWPFSFVGMGNVVTGQEHMLTFLSDLGTSLVGVSDIFITGKNVAGLLLSRVGGSGQLISPAQEIVSLQTDLFSVQTEIGLAQSDLAAILQEKTFPFRFGFAQELGGKLGDALKRYADAVGNVDKFLTLYPYISGFQKKQTFLILFQNSLELRPTGGFIGTIGTLTTEDGTISDFQVTDVYVVDGQLRGHVDPPGPIRNLLPSEHWYLRDSNWDPNFAASGERAAWFYEKETGVHVDGVIALTTPLIVNLLSVTGPISMRDYNDRITSGNFYGKALFYTSSDFFPGSTQKQNFLGSLARTLMEALTNDKNLSPVGLFKVLTDGLTSHAIMFYFGDPQLERLVTQFDWSEHVFSTEGCAGLPNASCYFDPLYVNEANLGVNKVNYFISRTISRTLIISSDGTLNETGVLSITNSSRGRPQDNGGTYRVYVRYFLPDDAAVDHIDIGGTPVALRGTNESSPSALPYAEYSPVEATGPAKIVGIAADIPAGGNARITVGYHRDQHIPLGMGGTTVELFTQKQPGADNTELQEFIGYPPDWNVWMNGTSAGSEQFLAKEGSLTYNRSLQQDSDIRIHVGR